MNGALQEALWLVFNHVPFDLAFTIDETTRAGFAIIFSRFHGNDFDFGTMTYRERS